MRRPRRVARAGDDLARAAPWRGDRDRRQAAQSHHRIEHQRRILGAAGERAMDLAGVPAERHRMVRREPRRRPDSDDAAERRRNADRGAEIGGLGERQHPRGDRDRRAARRPRRRQRRVPGIAGRAEHRIDGVGAGREFRRVGLAEQDGAGRLEAADHLGVFSGNEVGVERRTIGGADAGGLGHVLDAEGQAFERRGRLACHDLRLGTPRRLAGRVGGERHDRIEAGIEARDCREMRIEHFDRAHRPRAHHRGELDGGFSRQRLVGAITCPTSGRTAARSGGTTGSARSPAHRRRRSRHTCRASRTIAAPRTRAGRGRRSSR